MSDEASTLYALIVVVALCIGAFVLGRVTVSQSEADVLAGFCIRGHDHLYANYLTVGGNESADANWEWQPMSIIEEPEALVR